jgi:glutamate:Na+ symporter, ESS family
MPVIGLNVIQVLALSAFGVVMGNWLKARFRILDTLNIPSAVLGGLIYAAITTALRDRVVNFEMDLVLRDILMVAFFTTIGMSASLRLLKVGGVHVVLFFAIATAGSVAQNVLGVAMARVFGLDDLLGIIAGSVSLTGGPATALAFGADFEKRFGLAGAQTFGLASAMFGIVAGGLIGGWVGGRLIERHRLHHPHSSGPHAVDVAEPVIYAGGDPRPEPTVIDDESAAETSPLTP